MEILRMKSLYESHALLFAALFLLFLNQPLFAKDAIEDKQAKLFINKCSSCHSFGEGEFIGPDLKKASTFSQADLIIAITRMKEQAGELSDNEIQELTNFLKSPNVGERIKHETERQEKLEGSAELGKKLFLGTSQFKNGGLSCISCHTLGKGKLNKFGGGKLGPSLVNIVEKYGKEGLVSRVENSNWKVMRDVYKDRPVTVEEAAHLVAFFESVSNETETKSPSLFHIVGLVGCLFLFALVAFFYRNRLKDVRKDLMK